MHQGSSLISPTTEYEQCYNFFTDVCIDIHDIKVKLLFGCSARNVIEMQ